jgi:hypothetical protein
MSRSKNVAGIAIVVTGIAILSHVWSGMSSAQTAPSPPSRSTGAAPVPALPGGYYPVQVRTEQDAKSREIISQYKATEDEKTRGKLVDDLTAAVSEQFDARQEAREAELKQLEEQLRKLRELQARRAKAKEEIVRDRVRALLRDADGLGWGADEAALHATPRPGNRSVFTVPNEGLGRPEKVPVDSKEKR